ncbi:MAG: 4-hydroxy-tetrahydrodipicolinate reductase [candidate division WOR-3 bacterium]
MLKIVLCGAAGRMGKEIINLCLMEKDMQIIAGIEEGTHPLVNKEIEGIPIYGDLSSVISEADCVVEFTNHRATMENLKKAAPYKKPYLIGTTGFTPDEITTIKEFSGSFPIFLSPNMSLAVNQLIELVRTTAQVLEDYEIEIVETHHRAKKDAPSGTALLIAEKIKEVRPDTEFVHGRSGISEGRKRNEVGITAVRGGDVVGEHRILFFGKGEFLELRHYATNRQCFAAGTLRAIKFIVQQPPGLYSMADLLQYGIANIH